jgi:hypothetical protein
MKLVFLAALLLGVSDLPRSLPEIPTIPAPFKEKGNRRARRREKAERG